MNRKIKQITGLLMLMISFQISIQAQEEIKVRDFDTKFDMESDKDASLYKGKEYFFDSTASPVYDQAYDLRSNEWYKFQSILWQRKAQRDLKTPEAYLYYVRSLKYSNADKEKSDDVLFEMRKLFPDDYHSDLASWLFTGNYEFIKNAYKNADAEGKKMIYKDMADFYELNGKYKELDELCKEWKLSGDLSPELVKFAYNLIITPSENSILITDGDFDTYPLWVLQKADGLRPDLKILNLRLCKDTKYCDRKLAEFGLKGSSALVKTPADFVKDLMTKNPEKSLYISMTVIKPTLKNLSGFLNCEGLAYRIGKQNYMSVYKLVDNIENSYNTYYLDQPFSENAFNRKNANRLNLCYLVPLLQVYDYYKYKDNNAMALKFYDLAMVIAKKEGYEDLVMMYRFNW